MLGQGLAPTFGWLLAARVVYGLAFGVIWTAGLVLLSDLSAHHRRSAALGATVAVAGIGGLTGPVLAGSLADRFGTGAPFLAAAALAALITLALGLSPGPAEHEPGQTQGLLSGLRVARHEREVMAGLLIMLLGGFSGGVVSLLVPLRLHAAGFSAGAIGLLFSASSAIFIAGSALTTRKMEWAADVRRAGAGAAILATVLALPALVTSLATTLAVVLLRAPISAAVYTAAYPLTAAGSGRRGVRPAAGLALLNVAWGCSSVAGPVLAAAMAQGAGERLSYALAAALVGAGALWMLLPRPTPRSEEAVRADVS